eukprot:sb/3464139/
MALGAVRILRSRVLTRALSYVPDTLVTPDDGRPIYLDFQATTPIDPRVLDKMLPYQVGVYGNPHSRTHAYGWESETAVDDARAQVAELIGADPKEIVFTSGATESNNLAVKGVAQFYKGRKRHIITAATEHKCVLDSCRFLEREGFKVTYLPVQTNGQIDMEQFKSVIQPDTGLVSIMYVNNEIGVIQPVDEIGEIYGLYLNSKCNLNVTYLPVQTNGQIDMEQFKSVIQPDTGLVSIMYVNNEIGVIQPVDEIGEICRKNKIFFHTDAAQAVGKIPVNVNDSKIDLMSISGHKLYGPKGVGALYVRRRPRVRIAPMMSGGGQERGMRSGTVPTHLCVGMGAAAELAKTEIGYDSQYVSYLSERFISRVMANLTHVVRNGDPEATYPGCVNLSFAYVEGESLLMALKDIALSSGSACTSASLEPSYVLRALGADDDMAHSSIRFGFGRFTTVEEVDYTADRCIQHVSRLREMSPLWEMVQEGIDLKTIQWTQH